MQSCPYSKSVSSNIVSDNNNHYYSRPSDDDIISWKYERSHCPALNILVNHGYINRNDKAIDRSSIVDGMNTVFGVEKYLTTFLVIMAQLMFWTGSKLVLNKYPNIIILNMMDHYFMMIMQKKHIINQIKIYLMT